MWLPLLALRNLCSEEEIELFSLIVPEVLVMHLCVYVCARVCECVFGVMVVFVLCVCVCVCEYRNRELQVAGQRAVARNSPLNQAQPLLEKSSKCQRSL